MGHPLLDAGQFGHLKDSSHISIHRTKNFQVPVLGCHLT